MQHPFQTPSPPASLAIVHKKRSDVTLQTPVGQIYRTDPTSTHITQKVERPPVPSPTNSVCSEASTTSTDTSSSLRLKKKKPVKIVSSKFMQGVTSSATPQLKTAPKREKESVRTVRPARPSNSDCPIPKKPEKKMDMKPPATVTRSTSLRPRQPTEVTLKPSGTFTRTPSLPRLRSAASSKSEQEAIESSPNTARRVPVISSGQAAEICFDDNEAEIEVLQARLLQWNFINGQATQAFEEQKHQVEAQFKTVYSHIIGLKYELNQSKDMLHSFDSKEKLAEVVTTQMNLLNQINSRIEDFKENYLSLAAAAQSTSEIMPINGVLLEDMDLLYQEIRSCDATMQCILSGHEKEITKTTEMAQTIHNLWKNMQEIIAELHECNTLFKELSDIQKIENSHMLESILKA